MTVPGVPRTLLNPHPRQEGLLRLAREVRGVRSLGSVALELCALAAGEADLFVTLRSCPWDHNAGRIILAEAGEACAIWRGNSSPWTGAPPSWRPTPRRRCAWCGSGIWAQQNKPLASEKGPPRKRSVAAVLSLPRRLPQNPGLTGRASSSKLLLWKIHQKEGGSL